MESRLGNIWVLEIFMHDWTHFFDGTPKFCTNIYLVDEDEENNINFVNCRKKRFNLGVTNDNQSCYNENIYQSILKKWKDDMIH